MRQPRLKGFKAFDQDGRQYSVFIVDGNNNIIGSGITYKKNRLPRKKKKMLKKINSRTTFKLKFSFQEICDEFNIPNQLLNG